MKFLKYLAVVPFLAFGTYFLNAQTNDVNKQSENPVENHGPDWNHENHSDEGDAHEDHDFDVHSENNFSHKNHKEDGHTHPGHKNDGHKGHVNDSHTHDWE
ncbi:hypothetical protein [Aureivirga sp. CE67]|uniref:hypothetical protein n=1 Tax=Aureivirga sp. CE67 TaxID=1788983 RepID=UPI0018C97C9A|nr:hypothetical protein [Aureivirga sp. CE67]